jgi:hypothetical protein
VAVKRAAALAAALSAAAVLSGPAGATIHPQSSIAGVKLGMTQAEVIGVLGPADAIQTGTNEFGHYTVFRYVRLRVTFQGDVSVTAVKTSRKSEKTPHGVGVGSTRAQVLANVLKVRCTRRECHRGRFLPGRRVTVFPLYHGKVTSILVGFVID